MGFPSLKYSMNLKLSSSGQQPRRVAFAQAWLTQYAASDAVLDKAAKGHQSLARSPSLTCPEQMQCHGIGTHNTQITALLIISNPCLPRFLVRAEAFRKTRNRCIDFLNAKPDPFALAYDGVVSRRSYKSSVPLLLVGIFGFYLVWHGASLRPTEIRPWSVAGCVRGGR